MRCSILGEEKVEGVSFFSPLCSTQAFSDLGGAALVLRCAEGFRPGPVLLNGRRSCKRWGLVRDIQVVRNLHLKRVFEFWYLLHSAFFDFLGVK